MFSDKLLIGSELPEKTLCLTFDDGPGRSLSKNRGVKTLELAKYLQKEGIVATFFMVGKFVKRYPEVVKEVKKLGHIIGSHTYNHPEMVKHFNKGKNIVSELAKTENLIKDYSDNNTIYFRPPHGRWDPSISNKLNHDLVTSINYIGPVGWEIDAGDWIFWSKKDADAAPKCAEAYLKIIHEKKRGILLMHDSTADRNFVWAYIRRRNNKTLQTIKILIPQLKNDGYSFIGLNEVSLSETNE